MRLGFFAYPWDLSQEGPDATVEVLADRLHCTALALNANYHHARLLRPRAAGPKTVQLSGAVSAFEPQPQHYPASGPMPVPDPGLVEDNVLGRALDACQRRGLDFGLWTVGLHNSTLGERYPHLCMENCFGDRYTYNLCPSHAQVRAFLRGVIADLGSQFQPDRIIQEAVGYLSMRHWVHHELFFPHWGDSLELLMSLCFCPACMRQAEASGLDVQRLRQLVSRWSDWLMQAEEGTYPSAFTRGQIGSLLSENRQLAHYLDLRAVSVTGLVQELYETATEVGVELDLIPASFHRPVSWAWLEGALLGELGKVCNSLLIPAYHDEPAQVEADLEWASWLAPEVPLSVGLNACNPALGGAAALSAQVHACRRAGCTALYYFNYGLLTSRRLEWVALANAGVQDHESSS